MSNKSMSRDDKPAVRRPGIATDEFFEHTALGQKMRQVLLAFTLA
jgi:hypothetical protein